MTKEELAREAYEWTEKNISVGISMYNPSIEMYCGKAYKDGAEPREKRIAELEAQIEKMKSDVKGNIKWADENKNNQMYFKLNAMFNKWEIKENAR